MTKIPLEEIDLYSGAAAIPTVEQMSPTRDLPSWWRDFPTWWGEGWPGNEGDTRSLEVVYSEFAYTCRSIRDRGAPQTILHALILEDRQSRPEIAASIGLDPLDAGFRETLTALEERGIIRVFREDGIARYSLIMPKRVGRAYTPFEGDPSRSS